MAETGKRVEVRFGAFACAIEGYDDPVGQMREVLTLMQRMISETPALVDHAAQFGEAEVARLEHALDHGEVRGDAAPGIFVIRGRAAEPEDAETVDDFPPEAAGAGEAESFGEAGPESGFRGGQPADDAIAATEAGEESAPAEPGLAGAETPEASETRPTSDSESGAEAAGESEPGRAPSAETLVAGSDHEHEPAALFSGLAEGADDGREASETPADALDRPAEEGAGTVAWASAAAAAEAAFLADIAAAASSDEPGGTAERGENTAPEPGSEGDEAATAVAEERDTPSWASGDFASDEVAGGHALEESEAAEPLETGERGMHAEPLEAVDDEPEAVERDDRPEQPEGVETAVGSEPSGPPVEQLEDARGADASGISTDADQPDAGAPGPDASQHDTQEADRPAPLDTGPEQGAIGETGAEPSATEEPRVEHATSGATDSEEPAAGEPEAQQPATGEVGAGEPTAGAPRADHAASGEVEPGQAATEEDRSEQVAIEEADPVGAAIAASVAGVTGGSGTAEPEPADAAAAGEAGHGGKHSSPAAGQGDDLPAFSIFAPPPAGAGPRHRASVDLFAPPPANARPRDGASVNIFAPPPGASAPREPAFAGSGPAPASDRATRPATRAASLLDPAVMEAGLASRQNVFAPGLDAFEEPDALPPSQGLHHRPEARAADADRVAPEADAPPAPAPRRPEGTGRFAALLGRIYGSRGGGVPEAPSDAARPTAHVPVADPVGRAKGTSASDLAARAGARSVPDLLAASAAWLALVDDKRRFSRREVMEVFDSLPGPHERTLEARIKGFGKLVRAGVLVLAEEGVFSLSDAESDRYRELLDRG